MTELDDRTRLSDKSMPKRGHPDQAAYKGNVWVTRIHVDRIACAWLIRRFIDPAAQFKFVTGKEYKPLLGELRYDRFEA